MAVFQIQSCFFEKINHSKLAYLSERAVIVYGYFEPGDNTVG